MASAANTPLYGGPTYVANGTTYGYKSPTGGLNNANGPVLTGSGLGVNIYSAYVSNNSYIGLRAVLFTPTGLTPLKPINSLTLNVNGTGTNNEYLYAVNTSGMAVGADQLYAAATSGTTNTLLGVRATAWKADGTAIQLDTSGYGLSSSNDSTSYATAINNNGTSVGYVTTYDANRLYNQLRRLLTGRQ